MSLSWGMARARRPRHSGACGEFLIRDTPDYARGPSLKSHSLAARSMRAPQGESQADKTASSSSPMRDRSIRNTFKIAITVEQLLGR